MPNHAKLNLFFSFICSTLLISFCCSLAAAGDGTMTSGGGEWISDEFNPWFVGAKPVRYCVVVSEGFSSSPSHVQGLVRQAIDDWIKTFSLLKPKPTEFSWMDGEKKNLSLEFTQEDCRADTDLKFYFGKPNSEVRAIRTRYAKLTVAFAHRTEYELGTGRGRGFIWIAPDSGQLAFQDVNGNQFQNGWKKDDALFNVLLHELGHVYGFQHISNSFMDAGFPGTQAFGLEKTNRHSSIELHARNWLWSWGPKQLCGEIDILSNKSVSKDIFGNPEIPSRTRICLTANKPYKQEVGYTAEIEIKIGNNGNRKTGKAIFLPDLQGGLPGRWHQLSAEFGKKTPEGFDSASHVFLLIQNYILLNGRLKTATGTYAVNFSFNHQSPGGSLSDSSAELTLVKGLEFKTLRIIDLQIAQ